MQSQTVVIHPRVANMHLPGIRQVGITAPLRWLAAGASDFRHAWPLSLPYGIAIALIGYALTHLAGAAPHLALTLMSGFLFVAPLAATVFYFLSHLREHHHHLPGPLMPLLSWRHNPVSLGLVALMLMFVLSVWERLSAILVGLFLNNSGIGSLTELVSPRVFEHLDFAVAYLAFGGALAVIVFSLTVVSLPMLLHRKTDFATAIVTSVHATRANILPLLGWGVLLAVLVAIGFATQFLALALLFPLLGHASWHAYRDLIERE